MPDTSLRVRVEDVLFVVAAAPVLVIAYIVGVAAVAVHRLCGWAPRPES